MKLENKGEKKLNKENGLAKALKSFKAAQIGYIVIFLFGLFFLQISNFVDQAADSLLYEFRLYQPSSLPTIFLDIPYESLYQLETKREEALDSGILISSDDDFVPASMQLGENGNNIDIKIRLKGDWTDHLQTDKWSFRIHITENNEAVFGLKKFSLQAPETRTFIHEWAFHQHLQDEGILTTDYYFVNIVLNGQHKGIYALEESFSTELLESQQRREGVIFRFNEALYWDDNNQYFQNNDLEYQRSLALGHFISFSNVLINEISPYQGTRISNNPILNQEMVDAADLLTSLYEGKISAESVLDTELWGRFYAISDLWSAAHGTRWHNLRFYFNPVTGLIEPIAYDSQPLRDPNFRIQQFINETQELFLNVEVQRAYIQTLEKITQPEYLDRLEQKYLQQAEDYFSELTKEYSPQAKYPALGLFSDGLRLRADILRKNINPVQMVRGGYTVEQRDGKNWFTIDVVNLLVVPVQIESITIGNNTYRPEPAWCVLDDCQGGRFIQNQLILDAGSGNNYQPVTLRIPIDFLPDEYANTPITIQTNIYGGTYTITNPIEQISLPQEVVEALVPDLSLETALEMHPFLNLEDGQVITVDSGDWNVEGDLVIPEGYDLLIGPDTILRFTEGSVLLSSNPVIFSAQEEYPITLTAQDISWGGVVVLNASGESVWNNVIVEKTKGIGRGGWNLTGGVTFYHSPIYMKDVVFSQSMAEDALNIIRSNFVLERTRFSNSVSDGFDGDFVTGEVKQCWFKNIAGDGLDFSGSTVIITDVTFNTIGDKAISIGEQTNAVLSSIDILTTGIGVASKDLSTVNMDRVVIDDASVAGLAVYIKKPTYGPATLVAENTEIINTATQFLRQTGNILTFNGSEVPEVDFNTDTLYQ